LKKAGGSPEKRKDTQQRKQNVTKAESSDSGGSAEKECSDVEKVDLAASGHGKLDKVPSGTAEGKGRKADTAVLKVSVGGHCL
jgi:hypothetical protein